MSAPPSPPASVSLNALLASHDNDPHRALASLVTRYNALARDLAAVQQEKQTAEKAAERAAQENTQLWRSLKSLGNSSPRPGTHRQNSDRELSGSGGPRAPSVNGNASDSSTGQATKGLGIEAGGPSASTGRSLRRGPSGDSSSNGLGSTGLPPPIPGVHALPHSASSSPRIDDAFFDPSASFHSPSLDNALTRFPSHHSPSALRAKAATPPPHGSPRQHDPIAASNLRKASSLDLGRSVEAAAAAGIVVETPATPKTPPPPVSKERRPSSPTTSLAAGATRTMTGSASMPLLADPALVVVGGGAVPSGLTAGASGSRFLPSITPVSPLFGGASGNSSGSNASAPSSGGKEQQSFPTLNSPTSTSAAGEQLQQLQLPNGSYAAAAGEARRRERDRTVSSNSSLGSAFLDPSATDSFAAGLGARGTLEGSTATKQDRRRSMFLPLRSGSGGGSLAGFGFGGGGGNRGESNLPSTPSSHSLNLAALAESPASSSSTLVPSSTRERRPSRTHAPPPPYHAHGHHDSEGSTSSAPATLRRAPPGLNSEKQQQQQLAPRVTLTPALLPQTKVKVGSSNIKMNEKNKEVISFVIDVSVLPAAAEEGAGVSSHWKVEKMYSDVLGLDAAVKSKTNRQESKSMASLPDKSLFKDHAPHKSDQRKAVLERYLQTLVSIPLRDRAAICAFFNSDILPPATQTSFPSSASAPALSSSAGAGEGPPPMSGWLTKRGRNFGGWQTRYYVLEPGRALCYYDAPNGAKIGEIPLERAAIGRQSSSRPAGQESNGKDDDNAYLHAFLIRTRDERDQEADHILCADHDDARDAWVQALTTLQPQLGRGGGSSRPSTATNGHPQPPGTPTLVPPSPAEAEHPSSLSGGLRDRRRSGSGPAAPMAGGEEGGGAAAARNHLLSARQDLSPSVSLPSDLHALARGMPDSRKGATSDGGHSSSAPSSAGTDGSAQSRTTNRLQAPPSRRPSGSTASGSSSSNPNDRPLSPHRGGAMAGVGGGGGGETPPPHLAGAGAGGRYQASDVSGPMNAVPLPSGYEFKKAERQKKTKSSFWGFASRSSDKTASTSPLQAPAPPSRPVFGVPLKEAVAISRIRPGLELPAIVYRCVEYLEAKNAEHEEGIFRLSGSANVIRVLKDRFNAEGDVNLLQSTEYYDPHAIAGLLKQYLRELPVHLLTRELHGEFLRVIDLRNRRDRVNALGKLVARLPIEEYTLFRFFFAHLCLIAQNAETSKMGLRNLGIVFSPTLAIPAPLFSLLLAEFDLVFAVEKETGTAQPIMVEDDPVPLDTASSDPSAPPTAASNDRRTTNRNSQLYQASGADKLMEGELTKLRENDHDDDETSAAEDDTDAFADADLNSTAPLDEVPPSATSVSTPTLSPPPPRSPGLPSSPRPGATFSSA
ncbi:hypothetical protein JCM8547_005534 [Rhodosporidiobolus lusitaniae]